MQLHKYELTKDGRVAIYDYAGNLVGTQQLPLSETEKADIDLKKSEVARNQAIADWNSRRSSAGGANAASADRAKALLDDLHSEGNLTDEAYTEKLNELADNLAATGGKGGHAHQQVVYTEVTDPQNPLLKRRVPLTQGKDGVWRPVTTDATPSTPAPSAAAPQRQSVDETINALRGTPASSAPQKSDFSYGWK
jgi:hypothetical protein